MRIPAVAGSADTGSLATMSRSRSPRRHGDGESDETLVMGAGSESTGSESNDSKSTETADSDGASHDSEDRRADCQSQPNHHWHEELTRSRGDNQDDRRWWWWRKDEHWHADHGVYGHDELNRSRGDFLPRIDESRDLSWQWRGEEIRSRGSVDDSWIGHRSLPSVITSPQPAAALRRAALPIGILVPMTPPHAKPPTNEPFWPKHHPRPPPNATPLPKRYSMPSPEAARKAPPAKAVPYPPLDAAPPRLQNSQIGSSRARLGFSTVPILPNAPTLFPTRQLTAEALECMETIDNGPQSRHPNCSADGDDSDASTLVPDHITVPDRFRRISL